jgi:hypothetical protein
MCARAGARPSSRYERRRANGRVIEVRNIAIEDGGLLRTLSDITQRRLDEDASASRRTTTG